MNPAELADAAMGRAPFDLALTDAQLCNVLSGEIYPADVGILGDRIAFVGPQGSCASRAQQVIDADGRFLAPGLIDTHLHIESSMLTPANFAAAVLPHGTTTVVADPHELANVLGLEGVRYMLRASENLPLKVYLLAPSCVPAAPGLETSGAEFGAPEIREMLSWPRVIGLAEVMDYAGVIRGSERMTSILQVAREKGVIIGGHCPQLRGAELQAYMAAGPDSDHEVLDRAEMLEKIRAGMTIEAHESAHSQNVDELVGLLAELPLLPPNVTFCIDDLPAATLVDDGHIDRVLRRSVQRGLSPIVALRLATQHAASRCRLHDLGAVGPGRRADLVLFDDLDDFHASLVISDGRIVVSDSGRMMPIASDPSPVEYLRTVVLRETPDRDAFRLRTGGTGRSVRVISLDQGTSLTRFVTQFLPVRNGELDWASKADLCLVAVFERHGRGGHYSMGLLRGFGLRQGALASTVAHDSHNLIVVGRDATDMAVAAAALVEAGGGMACSAGGRLIGCVELPIAGLMSRLPAGELAAALKNLREKAVSLGVAGHDPLMTITELALPVIPEARFSDLGLVDVSSQALVPFWAD